MLIILILILTLTLTLKLSQCILMCLEQRIEFKPYYSSITFFNITIKNNTGTPINAEQTKKFTYPKLST